MNTMKSRFVEASCGVRNDWMIAAIGGLMLVAGLARAASLEWDSNGATTPNPQFGSGTWNTTLLNWWDSSTNVAWNNSNNDDATWTVTNSGNSSISVVGGITVNNMTFSTGPYTFTTGAGGQLTINGLITNSSGWATTLNVPIVGSSVINSPSGTLTLGALNSYTGATTKTHGKLTVTVNGALGSTVAGTTIGGASLDATAQLVLSGNFDYTTAEPLTLYGRGISGLGVLRRESGSGSYAGPITIGNGGGFAAAIASASGNTLTLTGAIDDGGANAHLNIIAASRIVLAGNNTYGGGTSIGSGNAPATLVISSDANLGAVPGAVVADNIRMSEGSYSGALGTGSRLRVTATTSLHANRGITFSNDRSVFEVDPGVTFTVNGGLTRTGAGGFTKLGDGTMVLKGNPTAFPLIGQITVGAGTLQVSNTSGSGTGLGAVVVNSGATLGGTGIIAPGGTAGITANAGATIAPGASIGTLRLSGAATSGVVLTMASGATFDFEVAEDGSTADQIEFWNYVSGDFALNGTAINLSLLGTPLPGLRTYMVPLFEFFSDAGTTPTGSGISSGLVLGTLDPRIFSAALVYNSNSIDLVYSVPEPASLALMGLAGLFMSRRRVRG